MPGEKEKRSLLGLALGKGVEKVLSNHYYTFDNQIYKQSNGGSIGSELTGEVSRVYMLRWDRKLMKKLDKLGWEVILYKRYVDDILVAVRGVQPGVRFDAQKSQLEVVEAEIEGNLVIPEDQRTIRVLNQVANTIDVDIKLTIDCPSLNTTGKLPCLDLQLWIDSEGMIRHEFYSKPMSSALLILRRSAVSSSVKRTTCFQEAIRRLRSYSKELDWDTKA